MSAPSPKSPLVAALPALVLVGLLGALWLLAVWPSFKGLLRYGAQGAMKGNLSGLRQRIIAYRGEHGGASPPSLDALLDPKTLPRLPTLWSNPFAGAHAQTIESVVVAGRSGTDSGKWAYVVSPSTPELHGTVFIDCTHTDDKGSAWTSY